MLSLANGRLGRFMATFLLLVSEEDKVGFKDQLTQVSKHTLHTVYIIVGSRLKEI